MSPFELGMWEVLQHMKPSRYMDGTHICSDHYDIDFKEFIVYWEIGEEEPVKVEVR